MAGSKLRLLNLTYINKSNFVCVCFFFFFFLLTLYLKREKNKKTKKKRKQHAKHVVT